LTTFIILWRLRDQTARPRATIKRTGLLDKNGNLIDEEAYAEIPYEGTQKHIQPGRKKRGYIAHFSDDPEAPTGRCKQVKDALEACLESAPGRREERQLIVLDKLP
jgi:hypothetical protein